MSGTRTAKAALLECRHPVIVSIGTGSMVVECGGRRFVVGISYVREAERGRRP